MELRFQSVRSGVRLRSRRPTTRGVRRCEPRPAPRLGAGQKMVEYENSDGGSVNVNFEVVDVARPLVAVGDNSERALSR